MIIKITSVIKIKLPNERPKKTEIEIDRIYLNENSLSVLGVIGRVSRWNDKNTNLAYISAGNIYDSLTKNKRTIDSNLSKFRVSVMIDADKFYYAALDGLKTCRDRFNACQDASIRVEL